MNNSPFEIFRRNLKPLMVFLTGLALFAFVVLPVLDSYMRQNVGSAGEEVVAVFDGNELSRSRVDYFTRNHQSTIRFLIELAQETIARGGTPRVAGFQYDTQNNQVQSVGINQQPSIDGTVRTFMLADQAQENGFELDDNTLQVWLEQYTDGMISNSDIDAMLMKSTQNQMGRPHLYEQLRNHLLAGVYLSRGYAGLYMGDGPMSGPLMTPQETWENFLKLNREAVVTTYGVLVNDYLDKTNPSPGAAEIQATYEEGKDRDPDDQSAEPAFHRPYSAQFEYLVASYDEFLQQEVAKLSEEEIRAEYEKRLKGGEFQLPETSPAESQPPTADQPTADQPATGQPASPSADMPDADGDADKKSETGEPATADADDKKDATETPAKPAAADDLPGKPADSETQPAGEESKPAGEESKPAGEESKPAGEESKPAGEDEKPAPAAEDKPAEDKPAEDKPAEDKPAEDSSAGEEKSSDKDPAGDGEAEKSSDDAAPAEPAESDQSRRALSGAVRLVALQEAGNEDAGEASEPAKKDEPAAKQQPADQPAEQAAAEETAADQDKPKAESSSDETPKDETPKDETPKDETPKDETPKDKPVSDDQPPADGDSSEEPKVETFEDVRQSIAESMAEAAARERMEAALVEVASQMQLYGNKLAIHESNASIGQAGEPPVKPDLQQLAEQYGLQYEVTEPHTEATISDEPIANSSAMSSQFGGPGPSFSVLMYGFDNGQTQLPRQPLFAPIRTSDGPADKQYVAWKIDETEPYTPTLSEVRDEVVMAIRMEEARKLAREAAEGIAKQASQAPDQPLSEFVPENRESNLKSGLGPFSWMDSFGFAGATIGNVPQLDSVGEEFMRAVFTADIGNYATAMNQPGRAVYVIKPTNFQPPMESLREQFKNPTNRMMAMLLGNDAGQILSDFYKSIDEKAGFVSYIEDDNP